MSLLSLKTLRNAVGFIKNGDEIAGLWRIMQAKQSGYHIPIEVSLFRTHGLQTMFIIRTLHMLQAPKSLEQCMQTHSVDR